MRKPKTYADFTVCISTVLYISCLLLFSADLQAQEAAKYRAVILRAAGYLPGTEKPTGEDAITHATSEPGNTYVFSDALYEEMTARGIETDIIDYFNCENLKCVKYNDSQGNSRVVDFLIFAGPSYGRKLPSQLLRLLPELSSVVKQNPDIVCSSLISANYTYRGIVTMMNFDLQLKQANARTITGMVLNSDVIEKELQEDLKDFVESLITEAKK